MKQTKLNNILFPAILALNPNNVLAEETPNINFDSIYSTSFCGPSSGSLKYTPTEIDPIEFSYSLAMNSNKKFNVSNGNENLGTISMSYDGKTLKCLSDDLNENISSTICNLYEKCSSFNLPGRTQISNQKF